MIRTIINGFCMAIADSVPGMSGGTVALIMGFYNDFVGGTHDVFYECGQKRKKAFKYLIKLGIGWIVGMILSVLVITHSFESSVYVVSSLFIGFIVASIPMLIREEKKSFKPSVGGFIALGVGIAFVILITMLNKHSFSTGVSMSSITWGSGFLIFFGAMASTSAMFLPGISGSTILLIMGLYLPVMSAGRELLKLHLSYLPGMIIFAAGIVVGALFIVKIIEICMAKFRTVTMFFILGLMIGSIYSIIMGPTTLTTPQPPITFATFNWLAFAIGVALIFVLQFFGNRRNRK